ncbi:MAG: chromosomal replication initiator protein [Solirubrobacteraceae bacterium]|nr:chromosomal replication initiator protein [Solirubrobacteraceae bacterium]
MRAAVPDAAYRIYLEPLRPIELEGGVLRVAAPASRHRWIIDRFGRVLQTCAAAALGPDIEVDVVSADPSAGANEPHEPATAFRDLPLNPKYTFDQFVIGDGNRLAHAAALAVAELPAQAYNPLFVYGPPGVGKTHLLHAIAHYLLATNPSVTVRCTTVEHFTTDFVNALQSGGMEGFKSFYRHTDVLLVDDIQFLESKARTEEEFFHTFNALYETGSQLVLTSDRLPRDMSELEARLCERFQSGLVADVRSPDFPTRLTILRKRAQHDDVQLAECAALDAIAERVPDNVRALEGALIRVVAYHSLTERPLTAELATEVLDRLYPRQRDAAHSVRDVQLACCAAFDISLDELLSRSRTTRVTWPRQLAMYLARELTDTTLPSLGRQFGGRDHTTVLHAHQRIAQRVIEDEAVRADVDALRERLSEPSR